MLKLPRFASTRFRTFFRSVKIGEGQSQIIPIAENMGIDPKLIDRFPVGEIRVDGSSWSWERQSESLIVKHA